MRLLLGVFALFLSVAGASAVVLDWSAVTWTAGSLSNTYNNVQGSGVNVTVAFSGSTGTLFAGSPNTTGSQIGGSGKPSLQADATFLTTIPSITVTITFSQAVYVRNFNILDVDADLTVVGWQDQISGIKGLASTGQTINPVTVVGGGSAVSVTGNSSTGFTALGQTSTLNDSTSNVSINFGKSKVTQITFVYSAGPNQPVSPTDQVIGLDNITFSLTPEVGPGLAAITLCGLVALVRVRKKQKKRKRSKVDFVVS